MGTAANLRNVATGGKGSSRTASITATLEAADAFGPGSCGFGDESALTAVNVLIVDDDGDIILNSSKNVVCKAGDKTTVKMSATYKGPKNCLDSAVPDTISSSDVFVTVTADQVLGPLDRKIQCKSD